MDESVERLMWLRKRAEIATKADAARAYGIPYEIYKKLEDGSRSLTKEHADTIARHHHVSRGWLMFGEGTPNGEFDIPLVGLIAGGQEIVLFDDVEKKATVDALLAGPDAVALEVRGDSMFPLAHNRDIIFVGPPRRDVARLVGYECAVQLDDGRRMFKVIERGSRPNLYDLRSYNAEPLRDVAIHSAGPFIGVRRRG